MMLPWLTCREPACNGDSWSVLSSFSWLLHVCAPQKISHTHHLQHNGRCHACLKESFCSNFVPVCKVKTICLRSRHGSLCGLDLRHRTVWSMELSTSQQKKDGGAQQYTPVHSIRWGRNIKFDERKLKRILATVRSLAMQSMKKQFHKDRVIESEERYIRCQWCCLD